MTRDPMDSPHASGPARCVFAYIKRRGGTVRVRPLLRGLGMDQRILVDAIIELRERYWIKIVWRKAAAVAPDDESRLITDIERIVTTRYGRHRYGSTWPVD